MTYLSTFLVCAFVFGAVSVSGDPIPNVGQCKWQMMLKTGGLSQADTRAKISMVIHLDLDPCAGTNLVPSQRDFKIEDLKQYGKNTDPKHAYFGAKNQVDTFEFNGPCWDACRVSIYSDGTGVAPGWFLAYATISSSIVPGVPLFHKNATVNTWLSVLDPPYTLNMTVNFCLKTVTVTPGGA